MVFTEELDLLQNNVAKWSTEGDRLTQGWSCAGQFNPLYLFVLLAPPWFWGTPEQLLEAAFSAPLLWSWLCQPSILECKMELHQN